MTVAELIEKLKTMPPNARVFIAGDLGWDSPLEVSYRKDPAPIADLPGHAVFITR